MTEAPVASIPSDPAVQTLEAGVALCLSGGGYRAMLFHVGALWRLYETGILGGVARISSVSGGSITAGLLGLKWPRLNVASPDVRRYFVPEIVTPIRTLAGKTIDIPSVALGALLPWRTGFHVARAYDRNLFAGATLQDLPDTPRFVINATNVQSGVLWRFMKPYMRDYRVGKVPRPRIRLADAVAASSAFPPVLSPVELVLKESDFEPNSGMDLQRAPFTTNVILADGGVYDNLGLETAWKRYQTILVSDAGAKYAPEGKPWTNWGSQGKRVLDLIDSQVRAMRTRQAIDSFANGTRTGTYWGIRTNIANYKLANALPCPFDRTTQLAAVATRLKKLDGTTQERLINWGYAVCDAALRAYVDPALAPPNGFPYPGSRV